jgi:hypothetical protein
MAGLFLHIGWWKIVEFLVLELVEIVHEGLFAYEGQELWLNLVSSLAFGSDGRDIIAIIVGE